MDFDGMTLIVKSALPETVDRHEVSALAMTRGKGSVQFDNNTHFVITRRKCK